MSEMIPARRDPDRCPSHPGELIEDLLLDLPLTKSELADRLALSRQHIHAILAGRKAVSPTVAAKLGKLFGDGPGVWLRMQAAYDAWHAAREVDVSDVRALETS